MKATEQYFPLVLFIMLYKMVLIYESVDDIPKRDCLYESYCKMPLSFGTVEETLLELFKWKLISNTFF